MENLQQCESLCKLDLTANFISSPVGLLSLASLSPCAQLRELFLTGNSCTDDPGYRPFVIATLPQLQQLDGVAVTHGERISAQQAHPRLLSGLLSAAAALGRMTANEHTEASASTSPALLWTPTARLEHHRADAVARRDAESVRRAAASAALLGDLCGGEHSSGRGRRKALPLVSHDAPPPAQMNEGGWAYTLVDHSFASSGVQGGVELRVRLGRGTDTSAIELDVAPCWVRLLTAGRMLCVHTQLGGKQEPQHGRHSTCLDHSRAVATRCAATGELLVSIPLCGNEEIRVRVSRTFGSQTDKQSGTKPPTPPFAVMKPAGDDEDEPPLM